MPAWAVWPSGVVLAVAVVLVIVRVVRGPTLLDRLVAVDVMLAVLVCGLGVVVAMTGEATFVPVLLAAALLGFVASVSVARLVVAPKVEPRETAAAPGTESGVADPEEEVDLR